MFIEGPLSSGKTSKVIEYFLELINNGISSSEILVICASSFKRQKFIDVVRDALTHSDIKAYGSFPVYTYNGIVYNSILDNWPLVESTIPAKLGDRQLLPDLSGLESTEYLLKLLINNSKAKFNDYYSGINLLHQLLRRYRLITENKLLPQEIKTASELLNQAYAEDADKLLTELKSKTVSLRCFDYLRQTNIFSYLIESNKIKDFDNVKYLIVDDFDELSYSAQDFVKYLMPKVQDFYITADPNGGSRMGYLCAYPQGWEDLKKIYKAKPVQYHTSSKMFEDAEKLLNNIKHNFSQKLDNIAFTSDSKRIEMLDSVQNTLTKLLETLPLQEISIIIPAVDENIKCTLVKFFREKNLNYQFLSGSKKLLEDKLIFGSIIIAQLINEKWKFVPSTFEIRTLLTDFLNIPTHLIKEILDKYNKKKKLDEKCSISIKYFDDKYKNLLNSINLIKTKELSLYDQLIEIFTALILPEINEDSNVGNLNSMLKSLDDFMKLINKLNDAEKPINPQQEWLMLIKNTVVTDNPRFAADIDPESIVIATPQKIVDMEYKTKYQLWLDVSSLSWTKDDTGPLYNSWVFQKDWHGQEYTPELHKKLTMNKTAHLLRKLVLCAEDKIYAFSSQLDTSGNENIGLLPQYISVEDPALSSDFKVIIPRPDQKPVVDYNGGYMAVPAVPGAGKTTIMQGLIIELIKKGVKPDEILVLTYMESAARLFLEKVKKNCKGLEVFPYISTIHGLAYRIIQEENNFTKLGLDSDFDICDEAQRSKIINEVCLANMPFGEDDEAKWIDINLKAISKAKLSGLTYQNLEEYLANNNNQQIEEFLPVFKAYSINLAEKSLIDFDDLLAMATKLLKEYPQIRAYYQKQYRYIIEDEAQDSSKIQQDLILMISDYYGNLIRCGDTNQAITTTFSNADVQGFRDYIQQNHKVEMLTSQRCAKSIYELANYLIDWAKSQNILKDAFLDLKMQPVEGCNPDIENNIAFKIHENTFDEKNWVVEKIKELKSLNNDFTFGILTRTNKQAFEWSNYLNNNDIKFICMTDTLNQRKVFKIVVKLLEFLVNPWKNNLVIELYEELIEFKYIKKDFDSINFLKSQMGSPFISYNPVDLPSEVLAEFWWELDYWMNKAYLLPEELVIEIGDYYFKSVSDRSNVYLLAALIKKFRQSFNDYSDSSKIVDLPEVVKSLKQLGKKNKIGGVKFFNEYDDDSNYLGGFVQVMTVHKAKGNEFDVVFVPEMNEDSFSYAITPDRIKIKPENALLEKLDEISGFETHKSDFEVKQEQIQECLRLIYVAITRAKKYLYMSSSYKRVGNKGIMYNNIPACVLKEFIEKYPEKN